MEDSLRLSALAVTAALLTLTLKKHSPELALGLTLCACALCALLLLSAAKPVLRLARELAARAELDGAMTGPLWKCFGLGLLTEISSAVCEDAEQAALAKIVRLGGALLCLSVSLPLLQAVLELIEALL